MNSVDLSLSRALIPRPTVQVRALAAHLEHVTDVVAQRALEVAKFEREHLAPFPLDHQAVLGARPRRLYQVLPPLTGQHKVIGRKSFVMSGPHREIGIEIFAPTNDRSGSQLRLPPVPGQLLAAVLSPEQRQTLVTHSLDSFSPVGKMPFLIFSHGWEVDPAEYRPLLEEIASHGYIVLNLNHPSSSGYAPFSKNPAVFNIRDETGSEDRQRFPKELDRLAAIQADNIRFVVEYIRKKEGSGVPIILAGHSLGGGASIAAARDNPNISGCINLDGAIRGEKSKGVRVPLLQIFSDHLKRVGPQDREWIAREYVPMLKDWKALHENSSHSTVGQIKDTGHMDFTIAPLMDWLLGGEAIEGALKAHAVASRAMIQFMNDICFKK